MAVLRASTRDAHATVDGLFSSYDLSNRDAYCAFLRAHARALSTVEQILLADLAMPALRCRMPLLAADIAILQQSMPPPLPFADLGRAGIWGALYVLEGSRLGGRVLSARVPPGFPKSYLGAKHEAGGWAAFSKALDLEAERNDEAWLYEAVLAANACFDLFSLASTTSN